MKNDLAPPGSFGDDKALEALANERARINSTRYREAGMHRSQRVELGSFLRRLASRPERIPDGRFYGLQLDPNVSHLFDHIRLYNRNGKPYAAIFHPYSGLDRDGMKALVDWAFDVGLQVCVDADSEYYPGVTMRLVLYREKDEFPETDLT
jgi:hypothetical protein